jgi:soluble lytic murein transglycosylase-like protein
VTLSGSGPALRRPRARRLDAFRDERGQGLLLVLALCGVVLAGALVLAGFGQALGVKGRHQRAADLAAMSAARVMSTAYPRLFEPAFLGPGVPNPRHLPELRYRALAKAAAVRAAQRNGVKLDVDGVQLPGGFAPTRVTVNLSGEGEINVPGARRDQRRLEVAARATAELSPPIALELGTPGHATGGGYEGALAYRMGKPMRPDVARAFDRLAAAARSAGLQLSITSAFRSDAEQARLFAAHPDPKWVAPPGQSLHRYATELDLGPPAAYGWLAANATRFGFLQRYSWEAWHYGYTRSPGSASVGFGRRSGAGPGGDGRSAVPAFVPTRFREPIARAAQRWNVGAALLSAQIYAESNFNPFARSPAGAQGIAQFMPDTAVAYGLRDPFDAAAAIDAQAHLMHDLLSRFGSVPLALAAYNAGPGAVAGCGCIPPYPETQAYVAKILGLLGGAGDLVQGLDFDVRLVE